MTTPRFRFLHLAACAALAAWLALGSALGQGLYLNEEFDVQLRAPSGWVVTDAVDADGHLMVQIQPPESGGLVVVLVAPITEADRAYWSGPLDDLLSDVWSGFQPQVPGANLQRRYDVRSGDRTFRGLDYVGPTAAGSLLFSVGQAATITVVSFAEPNAAEAVEAGLDAVLASFGPANAEQPGVLTGPEAGSAAGGNPLDTSGGANPLDTGGGGNPLDTSGAQAQPPLQAPASGTAFVGVFVGDRVRLELAASGEGLVGTLAVDGVDYPALARMVGEGLQGTFEVAGTDHAFAVEHQGDVLLLESGGARFELLRAP